MLCVLSFALNFSRKQLKVYQVQDNNYSTVPDDLVRDITQSTLVGPRPSVDWYQVPVVVTQAVQRSEDSLLNPTGTDA